MGFFSWITQDTNTSIANHHSSQPCATVYMTDDNGNIWEENDYEGYGVFGGKDYYELLAEMNGRKTREEGISIALGIKGVKHIKTHQIFLGTGIDFFNWQDDKLIDDFSANQLISSGYWKGITIYEEYRKFPNLTHDKNWKWKNEQPKDCIYQGYFY